MVGARILALGCVFGMGQMFFESGVGELNSQTPLLDDSCR